MLLYYSSLNPDALTITIITCTSHKASKQSWNKLLSTNWAQRDHIRADRDCKRYHRMNM